MTETIMWETGIWPKLWAYVNNFGGKFAGVFGRFVGRGEGAF